MKSRDVRRHEAEERQRHWKGLSPQAQLAALDARLGPGEGAQRQRARVAYRWFRQAVSVHLASPQGLAPSGGVS